MATDLKGAPEESAMTRAILIADTSPDTSRRVCDELRDLGYACVDEEFTTPEALCAAVEEHRPNVLIMDASLPGNRDLGLLESMRFRLQRVTVVVTTDQPCKHQAIKAKRLGAAQYTAKPYDVAELLLTIDASRSRLQCEDFLSGAEQKLDEFQEQLAAKREELGQTPECLVDAFGQDLGECCVSFLAELTARLRPLFWRHEFEALKRDLVRRIDDPFRRDYLTMMQETIQVLERTKGAFKSKELGSLRRRLETAIAREVTGANAEP
jgi:DNA-binding NarL/FixJ family response regulator